MREKLLSSSGSLGIMGTVLKPLRGGRLFLTLGGAGHLAHAGALPYFGPFSEIVGVIHLQ